MKSINKKDNFALSRNVASSINATNIYKRIKIDKNHYHNTRDLYLYAKC